MVEARTVPAPVLLMSAADLAFLKSCAAAAYPLECCGLLVGHDAGEGGARTVSLVVPTVNRARQPARTFEVDPVVHIALLRSLRQQEEAPGPRRYLIGHYHSHPDGEAVPSARDLAQAMEPGAVWVIAATSATGTGEVRAWLAVGDGTAAADRFGAGGPGVSGFLPMDLLAVE